MTRIVVVMMISMVAGCLGQDPCDDCDPSDECVDCKKTNLGHPLPVDAGEQDSIAMRLVLGECPDYGGVIPADRDAVKEQLPEGYEPVALELGYHLSVSIFQCGMNINDRMRLDDIGLGLVYTAATMEDASGSLVQVKYILEAFSGQSELRDVLGEHGLAIDAANVDVTGEPAKFQITVDGKNTSFTLHGLQDYTFRSEGSQRGIKFVWPGENGELFLGNGSIQAVNSDEVGPMSSMADRGMIAKTSAGGSTSVGIAQSRLVNMDIEFSRMDDYK